MAEEIDKSALQAEVATYSDDASNRIKQALSTCICNRCGNLYYGPDCQHMNTPGGALDPEEALRIRARYALGREFNPDHENADYSDEATGC